MQTTDEGKQFDPYAAPKAAVWAPEEPSASGPRLAGRGTRLGAVLIDNALWMVVGIPLYVFLFADVAEAWSKGGDTGAFSSPAIVITVVFAAVLGLGLFVLQLVLLAKHGQTLGKRFLKIRILRTDGSRAGLGRIFWLRMVVPGAIGGVPVVGPIFALVDALMIFGEARRCLHDMIADTKVVAV